MRGWRLLVWLASACTAPLDSTDQAVTNGTADPGDPAVVALVDANDQVLCTASVIGPHTGITAAHCFAAPPRTMRVFFGSTVAGGGTFAAVVDAKLHPGFVPATFANDVAMFTFREDAPVAPLALDARTIDASLVGATFAAVGFGSTTGATSDFGSKRTGTARIDAVTATELSTLPDPAQPCRGDSGGPMLIAPDRVAAVVSHGDPACSDHAIYARIDVARAILVDPYLAATAPGSAHTGDACLYDAHCAEGPCLQANDDAQLSFCSSDCARDSDCPGAMECAADGCRYPEPSPGAFGSSCTADAQCTTGTCHGELCTQSCLGAPERCPDDFECRGRGLDQYCVAAPAAGCGGCATGGGGPAWLLAIWFAWRARRGYHGRGA